MSADRLLRDLRAAGFTVDVDGGDLLISPGSKLPPGSLERVRAAKPALLHALQVEEYRRALEEAETGFGWAFEGAHTSEAAPATSRQLERLEGLAEALGPQVRAYVRDRVEAGLTERAAWRLLGALGTRSAALGLERGEQGP